MNKKIWIAVVLAFLPILILRDFTPANEGRYLVIADEALQSGNFFSFTLNGEPYADKPPLYFWLVILCRLLAGSHSMFLLSLLSFLPACGIVAVMTGWTRRLFTDRNRDTALLMLMTTVYFTAAALVVRMDMLMTFFMVLAFRSFWRMSTGEAELPKEQWLFGLWLFLALFTKGPLGLFIPLVGTLIWLALKRQWKSLPPYLGLENLACACHRMRFMVFNDLPRGRCGLSQQSAFPSDCGQGGTVVPSQRTVLLLSCLDVV